MDLFNPEIHDVIVKHTGESTNAETRAQVETVDEGDGVIKTEVTTITTVRWTAVADAALKGELELLKVDGG